LRYGVTLIGTLAAGCVLAGCGGVGSSSNKSSDVTSGRFEQHGFEITFRYPQSLKDADDLILGETAGAADIARAGVGIDRDNVILVTRYDLRRPITKTNVADVRAEVDGVIKGLAGRDVPGSSVTFGGLPGYQYRVPLQAPKGAISRLFVLFDGAVEYFFNCQSTPESRAAIDGACDQALGTLERV
jgi:hypothetical protein